MAAFFVRKHKRKSSLEPEIRDMGSFGRTSWTAETTGNHQLTPSKPNDRINLEAKEIFGVGPDGEIKPVTIVPKEKKSKGNIGNELSYLGIGYYLVVPLLLGVVIGILMDKWLKVQFFVPVFIILGAISSFYNLWRLVKNKDNEF